MRRGFLAGTRGSPPSPGAELRAWVCGDLAARVLGDEPSPILPLCPHSQPQLQSLKIGFPGAGQARALGGASDIGRAPRQVPSSGLDTIIPGPMPVPTRIRIELSKVRSAGARLLGSARPVHRRGRAVRLRFGNAGYKGVLSGAAASALASRTASPPRSGPPRPEGARAHHPRHPEGNCNSSVFSRHFAPTSFCFVWF